MAKEREVLPTNDIDEPEAEGVAKPAPLGLLASRLLAFAKRTPAFTLGMGLAVGLLVGWLVLGWLLFPIQWTNTDPWDLRPDYQRQYVGLVAESFARNGDIRRVRQALNGWNQQELTRLLNGMITQEPRPETRKQVQALADALQVAHMSKPLLASLLDQKGILLAVVLAVLPLLAAIVLVTKSVVSRPAEEEGLEELTDEETEEALAEAQAIVSRQAAAAEQEQQAAKPPEEKKAEAGLIPSNNTDEEANDILNSLFDDDNEGLDRLEALSKGLGDLTADELLKKARDILEGIRVGAAPLPVE